MVGREMGLDQCLRCYYGGRAGLEAAGMEAFAERSFHFAKILYEAAGMKMNEEAAAGYASIRGVMCEVSASTMASLGLMAPVPGDLLGGALRTLGRSLVCLRETHKAQGAGRTHFVVAEPDHAKGLADFLRKGSAPLLEVEATNEERAAGRLASFAAARIESAVRNSARHQLEKMGVGP